MPRVFSTTHLWIVVMALLLVFAGTYATQGAEVASDGASESSGKIKSPISKHDSPDQLFRRAPMAEASRSIAVSLATNLHVAFDAHLLRTHTVWTGSGLNLLGTPYHGNKSPFLCTYDGPALWTMPPFYPWSAGSAVADYLTEPPANSHFRGISTKSGAATFLYDLALSNGGMVRVQEVPQAIQMSGNLGVLRSLEVAPCSEDLWFLAHAEMGKFVEPSLGEFAVAIQRAADVLLVVALGDSPVEWRATQSSVAYETVLLDEKAGESIERKVPVRGEQARACLRIPPHQTTAKIHLATFVCASPASAKSIALNLLSGRSDLKDLILTSAARFGITSSPIVPKTEPPLELPERGDEYYRIEHFPIPKDISLRVTGMDWVSSNQLAVATWQGEIYTIDNATGPIRLASYRKFAQGLCEPLGLKVYQGKIYGVQKPELTAISDTDGDGTADLYETIADRWGYTGNYHAFAFGPVIDGSGNFYAFICGQRGRWDVPYVGWCLKANSNGTATGFCNGLRAPNGFGTFGPNGDLFVTDNQGNWVGACKLNHLQEGKFYGYPSGTPASKEMYDHPKDFAPPALWFPRKLAPSASGFTTITDQRFGPFQGQMLVGDFQNAVVLRASLEQVNGVWQGAVWPFVKGFFSGVNRLSYGPDGKLYVGGLQNGAWPSAAPKDSSLDRVSFTGELPFEVKDVQVTSQGFELFFTDPVEKQSAEDPQNYSVSQFNYLYHAPYGSPEMDYEGKPNSASEVPILKVETASDQRSVRLQLSGLRTNYVTAFRLTGISSLTGKKLWHDAFYYTLNQIPKQH